MRLRPLLPALLVLPVLTACVDDRAAYELDDSGQHYLALIREQPYFWDKKVNLSLVVSRMPHCMRRHSLGAGAEGTRVEIYQVPSGAFIVKAGKRMYALETQTCVGFARMDDEPAEGMGELKGAFRGKAGQLSFAKEAAGKPATAEE